jgi:mono/diheme cytochrome c family protein
LAGIIILAAPASTPRAEALAQLKVPSGVELFREHCAQCHGADATGNGPMDEVLKIKPTDLTAISKRNDGKFPADRIVEVIRYGGNVRGHGSQVMPIWGTVFNEEGGRGRVGNAYSRKAVIELKRYLESIQAK